MAALAAVAAASCATGRQVGPQTAREQQWIYRTVLGSGDQQPTAVFLAWDYSGVIFSATCDKRTGELVLRSEVESKFDAPAVEPIEISSTASTVRLRTRAVENYLEGRSVLTEELNTILRSKGDLEVFVPSEMGEPLYVGRAAPLRKVALGCRS